MFITKTLAYPSLGITDCLKIVGINNRGVNNSILNILQKIILIDDFDISDDELLAHICIKAGIFSYRDWQELINTALERIRNIDYEVDSSKRRLSLEETVYQMGGFCGKVSADGYKMLSALCARELVFGNIDSFSEFFGLQPRDYIEKVWNELDDLLTNGFILGEYTFELHDLKHQKYD